MKKIFVILFVAFALVSCGTSSEDKIEAVIDSAIASDTTVVTTAPVAVDTTVVAPIVITEEVVKK